MTILDQERPLLYPENADRGGYDHCERLWEYSASVDRPIEAG